MAGFNHYAKLKRILSAEPPGWYIKLIPKATTATNFKGETVKFDHYYRLYSATGVQIKYGKFQQLDRLAQAPGVSSHNLPVIE